MGPWIWAIVTVVALGLVLMGSNIDPVGPGGHVIRSADEFQATLSKAFDVFEPLISKSDRHVELTPAEQDQLRENASQFEQLAAFNNASVAPQYALGKIYAALTDYPRAEEKFRQAIDNQPIDATVPHYKEIVQMVADSRWELAQRLQQDNDAQGALEQMNAALKIEPKRPEYYVTRAQALIQLKKLPAATTDLNHALKLNPQVERAGSLLKFIGDPSKDPSKKAAGS